MQLHVYVYLAPTLKMPPYINRELGEMVRPESSEPTSSILGEQDVLSISSPRQNGLYELRSDDEMDLSPQSRIEESAANILYPLNLTESERESILRVPAARNLDDLRLFARLCPYFNGNRHLEDIMYYENVRRSQLLALIDKFREVLITCQYEDSAVAQLSPYDSID